MLKKLFYLKFPDIPLAGRLKYFQKNWKILIQDPKILSIVKDYDIPFVEKPYQYQIPAKAKFDTQTQLVNQEIQDMLKKGAIEKLSPVPNQFLSNIFLVKNGGKNRPVINLKKLNSFIPYNHFKMEIS